MSKKQILAAGTKVRVSRKDYDGWEHGIKFGAVATVLEYDEYSGEYLVSGPLLSDVWCYEQWVCAHGVKLAKQANRKMSA